MPYSNPDDLRAHTKAYYNKHRENIKSYVAQWRKDQLHIPVDVDEFWSYVDRSNPDGCWPWLGARNSKGYGEYRNRRAHRIALELTLGHPLGTLRSCHRCDYPPCCRPDHLFAGTDSDNAQDAIQKGRRDNTGWKYGVSFATIKKGWQFCPRGHPYAGDNLVMEGKKRRCRTCRNNGQNRRYRLRQTGAGQGNRRGPADLR